MQSLRRMLGSGQSSQVKAQKSGQKTIPELSIWSRFLFRIGMQTGSDIAQNQKAIQAFNDRAVGDSSKISLQLVGSHPFTEENAPKMVLKSQDMARKQANEEKEARFQRNCRVVANFCDFEFHGVSPDAPGVPVGKSGIEQKFEELQGLYLDLGRDVIEKMGAPGSESFRTGFMSHLNKYRNSIFNDKEDVSSDRIAKEVNTYVESLYREWAQGYFQTYGSSELRKDCRQFLTNHPMADQIKGRLSVEKIEDEKIIDSLVRVLEKKWNAAYDSVGKNSASAVLNPETFVKDILEDTAKAEALMGDAVDLFVTCNTFYAPFYLERGINSFSLAKPYGIYTGIERDCVEWLRKEKIQAAVERKLPYPYYSRGKFRYLVEEDLVKDLLEELGKEWLKYVQEKQDSLEVAQDNPDKPKLPPMDGTVLSPLEFTKKCLSEKGRKNAFIDACILKHTPPGK